MRPSLRKRISDLKRRIPTLIYTKLQLGLPDKSKVAFRKTFKNLFEVSSIQLILNFIKDIILQSMFNSHTTAKKLLINFIRFNLQCLSIYIGIALLPIN